MKVLAICLYLIWFAAVFLLPQNNIYTFTYITIFQFFVPGILLAFVLNIHNRSVIELLLYGAIFSYIIFLLTIMSCLRISVSWDTFLVSIFVVYVIILIVFLMRGGKSSYSFLRPPTKNEILVCIIGMLVAIVFSHVSFRNDATYYIKRIKDLYHSNTVEFTQHDLIMNETGQLEMKENKLFMHDWQPYFNYLTLPLKLSKLDFRYAWYIYTKLYIFISILAVLVLGNNLLGPAYSPIVLALYFISIFPLAFYYGQTDMEIGVIFSEMAYPRMVSENIFYFAFLNTMLQSFRTHSRKLLIIAGLILLCLASQHLVAFSFGAVNLIMFTSVLFCVSAFSRHGSFDLLKIFFKRNFTVVIFSLLFFLLIPDYFQKITDYLFAHNYQKKLVIYDSYINIVDKTWLQLLLEVFSRSNLMIALSVAIGLPFLLIRTYKSRSKIHLFLLSNLFVYLLLKFPLYNPVYHLSGAFARRFDAALLSCFIVAFLVIAVLRSIRLREGLSGYAAFLIVLFTFIFYGTESYASTHWKMWNWGRDYFKMTKYLEYFEIDKVKGITVLTDYKTALDVYANLDAYLYNYDDALKHVAHFAITNKMDDLLYSPNRNAASFKKLTEISPADFIIFPKEKYAYLPPEKMKVILEESYPFYRGLKDYDIVYEDGYYVIFKNKGSKSNG